MKLSNLVTALERENEKLRKDNIQLEQKVQELKGNKISYYQRILNYIKRYLC